MSAVSFSLKGLESLISKECILDIYKKMLYSRVLEDRLIKIYKAGEAYFWIGGPGEEAFGVPLGLLALKGQGPQYDYFHLHYRCTPTLVAMGLSMIDSVRLIMNRSTDRCTGGRNFSNHYCFPSWNVAPVTSPIGVQYVTALGTAHVQKKISSQGLTVVTGGDAGTAEGDFASCLVWSSRKNQELPMLITVQNNGWGISTAFEGQHGESCIADRAKAFNIRSRVINGLDPIECYCVLKEEMAFIRQDKKPSFLEARVSRLYGHSSASGANRIPEEACPVALFEEFLLKQGILNSALVQELKTQYEAEGVAAQLLARQEAPPSAHSLWEDTYVDSQNPDWRSF
jgi:2-oxoisovalerate dehydrogenase E1 component alpha subunit